MDVVYELFGNLFEWDAEKAESNLAKHGIDFREAAEVFLDDLSRVLTADEGEGENRWALLGRSRKTRLLMVVHTERGVRNRIISARTPTAHERRWYEQQR